MARARFWFQVVYDLLYTRCICVLKLKRRRAWFIEISVKSCFIGDINWICQTRSDLCKILIKFVGDIFISCYLLTLVGKKARIFRFHFILTNDTFNSVPCFPGVIFILGEFIKMIFLLSGPYTLIYILLMHFQIMQNLKMSSGKWRPFCIGLNVLTLTSLDRNGLDATYTIFKVQNVARIPNIYRSVVPLLANHHLTSTMAWHRRRQVIRVSNGYLLYCYI